MPPLLEWMRRDSNRTSAPFLPLHTHQWHHCCTPTIYTAFCAATRTSKYQWRSQWGWRAREEGRLREVEDGRISPDPVRFGRNMWGLVGERSGGCETQNRPNSTRSGRNSATLNGQWSGMKMKRNVDDADDDKDTESKWGPKTRSKVECQWIFNPIALIPW